MAGRGWKPDLNWKLLISDIQRSVLMTLSVQGSEELCFRVVGPLVRVYLYVHPGGDIL